MTLRAFLEKKGIDKDLRKLLSEAIPAAIVRIREVLERDASEKVGSENESGEVQIKADVAANDILIEVLKNSGVVSSYVSEETEGLIEFSENSAAPFTVVSDPLDGSSLADVNFAVGTIIGIFEAGDPIGKKPGDMVAALFVVYGPHTTIVLAPGRSHGVHEFIMNMDGQFYVQRENLKLAQDASYFAAGNLRACSEREDYLKLVNYWIKNEYTLRYSGGMVPDVNHIFIKGNGVFAYPQYSKYPEGKLRLLFECGIMAYLAEEAGGEASDGKEAILEKTINEHHQRTPIYIGSKDEVRRCEEWLEK